MTKKYQYTTIATTITFGILSFLFFAFAYPHHIHLQEQLQLFRFGTDYLCTSLAVPGGLADWLSGFFTQFFIFSWAGALVISLLLVALQLLAGRRMGGAECPLYPLSFLPSLAAFAFFADENALLSGLIAILLGVCTADLVNKIGKTAVRIALIIALTPALYWLLGGISLVFVLCAIIDLAGRADVSAAAKWGTAAASLAILIALPLMLQQSLTYPLVRLMAGIHYHRYHYAIPVLIWAAALLVPACQLLSAVKLNYKAARIAGPVLLAAVLCCQCAIPAITADFQKEEMFKYDYLVRERQWNKILKLAKAKPPQTPITVECTNLALLASGKLCSDMFTYFQNGPAGLLPEFTRDHFSPVPTGEVYYHLGMVSTAQTFFFEAQEGIPDFQKSARLYKSLAKTNLINEDYEVARKYVNALKQTIFYRKWALETEKLLDDPSKISSNQEYARMRAFRMTSQDYMFSQEEMDSMLGLQYLENRNNSAALDCLLAWCMLRKDLNRFAECITLKETGLEARALQEAFILFWASTHDGPNGIPQFVGQNNISRFVSFISDLQGGKDQAFMQRKYAGTYWYYYYFMFK